MVEIQIFHQVLNAPWAGAVKNESISAVNARRLSVYYLMFAEFWSVEHVNNEFLLRWFQIGLDFTPWCAPTQQDRDDQMNVFVKQLSVSKELDLPVWARFITCTMLWLNDTWPENGNYSTKPSRLWETPELFVSSFCPMQLLGYLQYLNINGWSLWLFL